MTDIIIQGINGRMGRTLCELIGQRRDCRVVGGVDITPQSGAVPVAASLEELAIHADVLIDFSSPAATQNALRWCEKNGLPSVVCTTGLDQETIDLIRTVSRSVAVFKSATTRWTRPAAPPCFWPMRSTAWRRNLMNTYTTGTR